MQEILAYQLWLALPIETRVKLAIMFGISKTGRTVVDYRADGAVVTQDGYTPDDLRALTVEKMQEKLMTEETDFYALVETVVENIDAIADATYTPVANTSAQATVKEHKVEEKRKQKKVAHAKKK